MNINERTWRFVREHVDGDVRKLALQGAKDADIDLQMALQQIAGRQTARRKLPSWAAVEGIVYPPHLNMEQCSSEQTARYKAGLVLGDGCSVMEDGVSFVDLTGGFGVDFYWIAKAISHCVPHSDLKVREHSSPTTHHLIYIEQNKALCEIATHNFATLGLECSVCCCDTTTYLTDMPHVSLAFLDPARRNEHGGRTYGIEDCTPNVLELLPVLMSKADRVMLKLSPMLDWRKAVEDLKHVCEVHIVSIDNECKELLLVLDKERAESLRVVCVNLSKDGEQLFETSYGRQSSTGNHISHLSPLISHFLYEPNASIMKAGCFKEMEERFPVQQISQNSHLFLSSDEIGDFPGRKFQILSISSMNKQDLRTHLKDIESANISVRNFPMNVDMLRKKLKLKDGGNVYIFATTTTSGEHRLFICRKIDN